MYLDERVVKTLRTSYLEGEITEEYLRNLLDRNLLILEEFLLIIEDPFIEDSKFVNSQN
jgi:hypothetical protein